MAKKKVTRFRNTTGGYVGVVKYKPNGEEGSIAVDPHGTVTLTDDEIEATARAPREATNNPFIDQPFEVTDPETGEVKETGMRPVLVLDEEKRPTPAPQGRRGPTEETAARPRRQRAPAGAAK